MCPWRFKYNCIQHYPPPRRCSHVLANLMFFSLLLLEPNNVCVVLATMFSLLLSGAAQNKHTTMKFTEEMMILCVWVRMSNSTRVKCEFGVVSKAEERGSVRWRNIKWSNHHYVADAAKDIIWLICPCYKRRIQKIHKMFRLYASLMLIWE